MRQHTKFASEMSFWPCLTASKHEISRNLSYDETLVHLNLSHMDFLDDPAATHGSRLIISRFTKDEASNEHINPEISLTNNLKFTYSFALILLSITLADIISSCACIVLLSEASSPSHVFLQHCASAQTPGL